MISDTYFDLRNLAFSNDGVCSCPVAGCAVTLETLDSQWGKMPYCPVHRIRIHSNSKTFAYHNGPNKTSEQVASLRNILFEQDYFKANILDNSVKAETHRMGHETSEDAVTWNVFSKLAREGLLSKVLSKLLNLDIKSEPELYL